MKRILSIVLFSLLFVVISCNKQNDTPNEPVNPYDGTSWSKSYHSSFTGEDYMYILDFTKDTFSFYEADINGNYKSGLTQGAYTFNDNEITINNVEDKTNFVWKYKITGATVNGNVLIFHRYYTTSGGEKKDSDLTMMKR